MEDVSSAIIELLSSHSLSLIVTVVLDGSIWYTAACSLEICRGKEIY